MSEERAGSSAGTSWLLRKAGRSLDDLRDLVELSTAWLLFSLPLPMCILHVITTHQGRQPPVRGLSRPTRIQAAPLAFLERSSSRIALGNSSEGDRRTGPSIGGLSAGSSHCQTG